MEIVYVDHVIFDIHRIWHVAAHFGRLFEDARLSYVGGHRGGEEGIDGQSVCLRVSLELRWRYIVLAGGTIVIYDNLPVLALSASLSPLVMPRQIILSDVIPQEEGVVGALKFG